MRIERATPADQPAIEALLSEASLPLDGAASAFALGVVARDRGGVLAAAAVEQYGAAGLLRSVVVDADHRSTGLGRAIVAGAEALARSEGIREMYLITETAADWFPRLGYRPVERSEAVAAVGASIELTTICRDTGVPMHRTLD